MADDKKPEVSEEQVKAANAAQDAKWSDDFKEEELNIPYKRNDDAKVEDEPKEEVKTDEDDPKADPIEEESEPEPAVTMDDPGEYKPADYSFEVTLKDGKTVKISTPEEAEKIADDPDNFETPKQLMDFINKQNKMNTKLDKDYEQWESNHKTFTDQVETENQRRETVDNMVGEFQYLVSKGDLPAIDPKYQNADWSDPEVAKQPGVKEQTELLNYMVKENRVRVKAGVKPLTSILDTFNAWKLDTNKAKQEEEKKEAGKARQAAGARVAGVSPTQQGGYVPKGIAVGRVLPRNSAAIWDD